MPTVTEQAFMAFSGPINDRSRCAQALISAGFAVVPEHVQDSIGTWGLPSHTDPVTAHAAGKPNAGHQVDQPHPSVLFGLDGEEVDHDCDHVGQPYEEDTDIGWLSIYCDDVARAVPAATSVGWQLRLHTSPSSRVEAGAFPNGTFDPDEALFAKLEARYASLRSKDA